eukprot:3950030-Pleurochrysis_carterae.AAC.3
MREAKRAVSASEAASLRADIVALEEKLRVSDDARQSAKHKEMYEAARKALNSNVASQNAKAAIQ